MNLLFDLDGTISDPKIGVVKSIQHAMEQVGAPLDPNDSLDWCIGPPLQISLAKLLGEHNEHLAADALKAHRQRYRETGMFENTLYPGIPEVLEGLSKRSRLFIATSKPTEFAVKILEHFNVNGYFERVYGSDMDGTNSDKGELISHILSHERLDPNQTIMIGDREHDMIGAKKNQVKGIGAGWGYGTSEELLSAGATTVVDSPTKLQIYLLNIL